MTADARDLERFLDAQQGTYSSALGEIRAGRKRGHWMWYVFPQLSGLGRSEIARRYAIRSLDEARAYLGHAMLGQRLRECVAALQDIPGGKAVDVFGDVDAMKLRSSLTLFVRAGGGPMFEAALERWFGSADELTLELLGHQGPALSRE